MRHRWNEAVSIHSCFLIPHLLSLLPFSLSLPPLCHSQVVVPQWLYHHRDDFTKPIWTENASDAAYGPLSDLSLLRYLQSRLPREQAELLFPLLEAGEAAKGKRLPFKLSVKKESMDIGYDFKPRREGAVVGRSPRTSPNVRRKKPGKEEEKESSKVEQLPVGYTFTPETLAFVKQHSPLLAALAHLLCPPPPGKTSKTGHTSPVEKEEELEVEMEDGKTTPAPKKMILQSLRGKPKPLPPPLQKKLSLDEITFAPQRLNPWQRQLDELLSNFGSASPMRLFLTARLGCFNSILPWDILTPRHRSKASKKSSLEYGVSLRRLAALPSTSKELGDACSYAMWRLIEIGRPMEAVAFLASEPAASHTQRVRFFADTAISAAFVRRYLKTMAAGQKGQDLRAVELNPLSLLTQLSSPQLATSLALSSLHNWPVEVGVEILSFCSHHLPPSSPLLHTVREKLERMRVYAEVMASCDNPLSQISGEQRKKRSLWSSWAELASDSESKPNFVLGILLGYKFFSLSRKWAAVHSLGVIVIQVCVCTCVRVCVHP